MTTPCYHIGIDPGVHTGFAIYDKGQKKLTALKTLKLHQAFDEVRRLKARVQEVVIENPNLWTHFSKGDKGAKARLQGAGSVKRDYRAWVDFLTDEGISFRAVRPDKNRNKMATDRKVFGFITGYREQCSEHARVAAMLVFGK